MSIMDIILYGYNEYYNRYYNGKYPTCWLKEYGIFLDKIEQSMCTLKKGN